jgi:cytochrome P450
MTSGLLQIPPGPIEKYDTSQDILSWIDEQFKRFGDIYRASFYGTNVYVVSNPEYVEHVLRVNWQNYRKGQAIKRIGMLLGNGLMVSEGELWKKQRQMIQPAFHDGSIDRLLRVIESANAVLLKKWTLAAHEKKNVNITSDISHMVLEVILSSIFGDDYEQLAPHFNILSDEPARNLAFANMFRPLRKMVIELAAQRRKQNVAATDILGMLMAARDRKSGEPMPDNQLASEILTLVVAGHETTASTLNWVWYLLSLNPQAAQRLWSELNTLSQSEFPHFSELPKFTYTRQVIEETLRLYPPGWLITRKALKDDVLGDYLVPAGTEVYISPYLIQRHPDFWEDPDEFKPDRFAPGQSRNRQPMTMIPFLGGPRKCTGESHARVEMQIHLMMIAKHLCLKSVDQGPIELDAGVNLRSKHDFMMRPQIIHGKPEPIVATECFMARS